MAARHGADAIGLVFYPRSPRAMNRQQARAIVEALPPFVNVVALFVDPEEADVRGTLSDLAVDTLQFHGNESPDFCMQFGLPYLKAIPMAEPGSAEPLMAEHSRAQGFLLDSHGLGAVGGTGRTFDWRKAPAGDRLILAGGLHAGNVGEAIRTVRPYAVDVSSGVEAAPGVKDAKKTAAFIQEVNHVQFSEAG